MATGPEHYRTAETLVEQARDLIYGDGADQVVGAALAAAAQVHAALALAAATAMSATIDQDPDTGLPPADANAWYDACGVKTGRARR